MDPARRARTLSTVFEWMRTQPYIELADYHMLQDAEEADECCWGLVGPAPSFAPHEPAYTFFSSIAVSDWTPRLRAHPPRAPETVEADITPATELATEPATAPATEPVIGPTIERASEPAIEPADDATIYYVAAGDNLRSIAEQVYGEQNAWPSIYEANRGLIGPDPDALVTGAALRLPPVQQVQP